MIEADTRQHRSTTPLWPRLPLPVAKLLPAYHLTTLHWFIRIRYTISIVLFAILLIAYAIGLMPAPSAAKLAIANSLYLGATVFYSYLLKRNPSTRLLALVRNFQIPEKLLLCTIALYYSGGVLTPLFILYPLVILESIILTDPRGVYRTGLLAVAFYCSLAILEAAGAIPQVKSQWGSNWVFQPPSDQPGVFPDNYTTYALYVAIVSSVLLLTAYIGNRVALLISQRNRQIESQLQDSRTLYDITNKLGNMIDETEMLIYLATTSKLALDAELRAPFRDNQAEEPALPLAQPLALSVANGAEKVSFHNASICLVALLNKDGIGGRATLEIKAGAGLPLGTGAPPDVTSRLHTITSTTPGLVDLLQRGETLVINDIQQHPDLRELAIKPGSHSSLFNSVYIYPIKVESLPSTQPLALSVANGAANGAEQAPSLPREKGKGMVIGGIILSFDSIKPLSQEFSGLMTTITTQAALAIQRSQLISDARRLATEMSQLYTLGLYTGSTLSKDEVLRRTSDNIESLLKPNAYYISLYDEVTDILSFEVFVEHGRQIGKVKMPLDRGGVTSRIIRRGQPILVQDWSRANSELAERRDTIQNSNNKIQNSDEGTPGMLSYLGVPMLWEDRVIGVISVQCEGAMAFDPHDERLLAALAAQTAMALENAKLHQLAQDQGKLDSLTLVYNHGYFVELVRNAVAESDTDDTQVALIMLDIDHFKHYNDSFGHVAGDNVLKIVAQALKKSVRETDAVGRWGGEEFGILLLGVGITEAKKIARQVRRAISELSPVNAHGQVLPNPTISQGISSYPYPSATANDLIEEADTALYHAKKHGRNQLVVYEAAGGMKDDTTTTGHLMRSKVARETRITTGSLGRSRQAKQLEELTVTTNDLAHASESTTPHLTAHNEP